MSQSKPPERIITRRALFDLVWTRPLGDAAAQLSLNSAAALRQLCDYHEIPRPRSGHWTLVRMGNHVEAAALGAASRSELEFVDLGPILTRPQLAEDDPACTAMRTAATQLVAKTRAALQSSRSDSRGLRTAVSADGFDVVVSGASVERALGLLYAVAFELLRRGATFSSCDGPKPTGIVVIACGERIPFRIQEIVQEAPRKPRPPGRIGARNIEDLRGPVRVLHATGRFVVIIGDPRSYRECAKIREGKRQLESRVSEVAMMVFTLARLKTEHRAEHARKAQEAAERQRRIADEQRRAQAEEVRLHRLRNAVELWHGADLIRQFVSAASHAAELQAMEPDELSWFREWEAWALRTADLLDPLARGPLRFLEDQAQ